jgi:aryl-alcohol dehydrogenase-like predicted oxidoreductase
MRVIGRVSVNLHKKLFYAIHCPWQASAAKVANEGRASGAGRSSASMEIQKANGWAPFTHGQMHYSLLIRDIERDMIPVMERYRLGLTVWSPLVSGFLSGKYTRESLAEKDNRLSGFDIMPFDKEHGFRLVDKLREIAARHKGGGAQGAGGTSNVALVAGGTASVAQVAIAWLLSKKIVSSVILGVTERKRRLRTRRSVSKQLRRSSKPQQLDDNLAAADLRLAIDELTALDMFTQPATVYPNWFTELVRDPAVEKALRG